MPLKVTLRYLWLTLVHVKFGKNRLNGFRLDVVSKCCWTTNGQRMPAIIILNLTYEPLAQVS